MPHGDGTITIFFENAGLEESFFVSTRNGFPIPPVIVVVVVVVVCVILMARYLRRRKPSKGKPEQEPTEPQVKINFIVSVDPGMQSVELGEPSLTMDINLRFELDVDPGDQSVMPGGDSLINRE